LSKSREKEVRTGGERRRCRAPGEKAVRGLKELFRRKRKRAKEKIEFG